MTERPTIAAYNLAERVALLDDGRAVPIATLFDEWGEETESVEDTVWFVAGADGIGWFNCGIELDQPTWH